MRSLPASQAALAASSVVAAIPLVHLTTYSDVGAQTVEAEYWWTHGQDVLYKWDGVNARTFENRILDLSAIERAMEHLPNGALVDLRRTTLAIVLGNDAGLWAELRTRNLLFSRVEVAVLLIAPDRRAGSGAEVKAWDLRDLPGTDHVFHFRGELTEVGQVSETEIPLTFETIEPGLSWPFCSVAAECDPKDLGKRYPIPVGRAKSVPVINRKVGWVTTMAVAIATPTATGNHTVTDASGLSGSGIELQIGAERVLATAVDATTINITNRGQQGTTAIAHNASETVVEILSSNVLVFSGIQAKALDALYVISPLTGDRVLIPSSLYTTTLADSTTDSGRTISTVTFTAAQFRAMLDSMLAVSQQPTLEVQTVQVPFQAFAVVSRAATDTDAISFSAPDAFRHNWSNTVDEAGKVWWESDAGIPSPNAAVIRFRIVWKIAGQGGPGDGGLTQDDVKFLGHAYSIYGETKEFSDLGGGREPPIYIFDDSTLEQGILAASAWFTPSGSHTVGELVNAGGGTTRIETWVTLVGGGFKDGYASCYLEQSFVEVEIESDLTDVGVAALSLGWGMDFAADVQGAQTGGTLHESIPDILEWFLEVFAGLGASAADATTFATAETNLGSNKLAGVLNLAGETFGEVLARLCYEGRCNLAAREGSLGTTYLLFAAESDFEWPASVRTLSEFRNQSETAPSATEQATRFRAGYNADLPPGETWISEEHFRGLVRIDPDQNDASALLATALLEAAEDLWGRRDAELAAFLFIADEATAKDILAYYAHEAIRRPAGLGLTVPFDLGYDLELGDVVTITPRGHASALKARVLQTTLELSEPHVGLVLKQVL